MSLAEGTRRRPVGKTVATPRIGGGPSRAVRVGCPCPLDRSAGSTGRAPFGPDRRSAGSAAAAGGPRAGGDRNSRRGGAGTAAAAIVLLAAGAIGTGCAPAPAGDGVDDAAGGEDRGAEAVMLAVDHRTRWRELRIEGATDLPDGAVVTYQITHGAANELPRGEWPAQNLMTDGAAVVRDGVYWARINTTDWPPGRVDVLVQFPVAPQPEPVRIRYGPFGEHLTGGNVSSLGGSRVVTAEHAFDWTR